MRGLSAEQISKARTRSIEVLDHVDRRATFTLIAAAVVFTALLSSWLPPSQQAYDLPTQAAQAAAQGGRDQIRQALLSDYDVASVNFDACTSATSAKDFFVDGRDDYKRRTIEQQKNIDLLERATKNDPFDAPAVGVLTADGLTACYHLTYNNTSGQATLVAPSGDSDAPTPAKLRR